MKKDKPICPCGKYFGNGCNHFPALVLDGQPQPQAPDAGSKKKTEQQRNTEWEKELSPRVIDVFGDKGEVKEVIGYYVEKYWEIIKPLFRKLLQSEREKTYKEGVVDGDRGGYERGYDTAVREVVEWAEKNKKEMDWGGFVDAILLQDLKGKLQEMLENKSN